jgi:hypothetical protein
MGKPGEGFEGRGEGEGAKMGPYVKPCVTGSGQQAEPFRAFSE